MSHTRFLIGRTDELTLEELNTNKLDPALDFDVSSLVTSKKFHPYTTWMEMGHTRITALRDDTESYAVIDESGPKY